MKDLMDVVTAAENALREEKKCAIATIMRTIGSSYRTPGARLLIEADGRMTGVLSGGCLEADLFERARSVIANNSPTLVTYDTSAPQEIVDGLGIGCNGKILIFLEPISHAAPLIRFITERITLHRPGVVATVYHVRGFPDVTWGSRCTVDENGITSNTIPHEQLTSAILGLCADVWTGGQARSETVEIGVEAADVLVELIRPPQQLYIFGSGPGSQALARLAKQIGWDVSVYDHKEKASHTADFKNVDALVVEDFAVMRSHLSLSPAGAAVVMSHNFEADREYLNMLLPSPVKYIGLLGSRSRKEELMTALKNGGVPLDARNALRIHNPAGLDTGAEGPEEIAISILAEIRSVLSGRAGGFLRDREGPIHEYTAYPRPR